MCVRKCVCAPVCACVFLCLGSHSHMQETVSMHEDSLKIRTPKVMQGLALCECVCKSV
jgi:hypothetical protein